MEGFYILEVFDFPEFHSSIMVGNFPDEETRNHAFEKYFLKSGRKGFKTNKLED